MSDIRAFIVIQQNPESRKCKVRFFTDIRRFAALTTGLRVGFVWCLSITPFLNKSKHELCIFAIVPDIYTSGSGLQKRASQRADNDAVASVFEWRQAVKEYCWSVRLYSMKEHSKYPRQFRVSLQLKAGLILAVIVFAGTAAGGWFYFDSARALLRRNDLRHAMRLGMSLAAAAKYNLRDRQTVALERLANDYLSNDSVHFVAILDSQGTVVASASRERGIDRWSKLIRLPVSLAVTQQKTSDELILARPVILREALFWKDHIVGNVRLVMDTSSTTKTLAQVRQKMIVVTGAIVIALIPVGYLLVWRVVVQPIRKLAAQMRRLTEGDFDARAGFRRNDEVGELAVSFDNMADEIADMRTELVKANENLERKVVARTQQIQKANSLLEAEMTEKEEFLRAVSHDLNAPLRNISGMATLMLMKWEHDLPEEVTGRLQRIQANVEAETSLISELLELSRIRSRPQKRVLVNMKAMMEDLSATFEFELKSRRIQLQIQPRLPHLYAEENRIRQVFQNLIDNAIKYMHRQEGGKIRIGYDTDGEKHRFWVRDNGPGIQPGDHRRVFQVFRRSETAISASIDGKGVGLAMVKSVMANYGGRAWVESSPGDGAAFYVTFDVSNTEWNKNTKHEQDKQIDKKPSMRPVG